MSIDNLDIQIQASSKNASAEIDKLIKKLNTLQSSLTGMKTSGLDTLSSSITNFASSLSRISADDSKNLNAVKNSVSALARVNTSNLNTTANGITNIANAINKTSGMGTASTSITTYASAISKLGGTNSTKAISNIPLVTSALQKMIGGLSNLNSISESTNSTIASISNLTFAISKLGGASTTKAIANLPLLANAFKSFITSLNSVGGLNSSLSSLISNLAKLSTNGAKVGTSASSISRYIKSANTNLNLFNKTAKNSTSITSSLASQIGKLYAAYFWITRIVGGVTKSITSAMDYIETYNYYNVVTDKIGQEFDEAFAENGYGSAEAYAKSFKDRMNTLNEKMTGFKIGEKGELSLTDSVGLGLDPEKIMGFQAQVLSITNAVGLMGETSVNTAKALTMLAGDVSSLENMDLEDVMNDFTSALIGQSRAVYKFGWDITNATLQQYAYAEGVSKAVSEMTQSEKMQLRMLAILGQSKVAWGDLIGTVNTAANQYRIFKEQISNLSRIIGSLFVNSLQVVLPYISAFVVALQRMFTWIGNMLGVDWTQAMDSLNGYKNKGLEKLGEEAEGVASGFDDATKSAKKLSGYLGYHELNNMTSPTESSGGIGGIGGGEIDLSDSIADALDNYQTVWDKALENLESQIDEYANKIVDYFKKIKDAWTNGADLTFVGEDIGKFINAMVDGINWESVKNTASKIGKAFATTLNGTLFTVDSAKLGSTIAEYFNTLFALAKGFVDNFDFKEFGSSIAKGINGFFNNLEVEEAATTFSDFVLGIIDTLKTAISDTDWTTVGEKIADMLEGINWSEIFKELGKLMSTAIGASIDIWGGLKNSNEEKDADLTWWEKQIPNSLYDLINLGGATVGLNFEYMFSGNEISEMSKDIENLTDEEFKIKYGVEKNISAEDEALFNAFGMTSKELELKYGIKLDATEVDEFTKQEPKFENITTAFSEWWSGVETWWNETVCAWWDINVSPWFSGEKWGEMLGNIRTAFETKWEEVETWWNDTIVVWWDTNVAPWFDIEKWKKMVGTIYTSIKEKFTDTVTWWKTKISTWWEEDVKKYFSADTWLEMGTDMKDNLIDGFKGVANGIIGILNNVISGFESLLNKIPDGINEMIEKLNNSGAAKWLDMDFSPIGSVTLGRIPAFRTGGFPEDGLFMANSSELIGKFSNGKTAVANNSQIVSGISQGVSNANDKVVSAVLMIGNAIVGAIQNGQKIEINGQELFSVVQNESYSYEKQYGEKAFT